MSVGLEIHDAASTGDYDSLEEYLKSGKFDVNLKDEEWNNRTALHWACAKGTHTIKYNWLDLCQILVIRYSYTSSYIQTFDT